MKGQPTAKIILDSFSPNTFSRLTTVEAKIHRFVLAELNTHRVFSRNSASSRAIPVKKMLDRAINDPAIPLSWGRNQKGMSASDVLSPAEAAQCEKEWLIARDNAVNSVLKLNGELNLHKQVANRLLEPFQWHVVIISATEWDNFFWQRCDPNAQPEMQAAAYAIQKAYYENNEIQVLDFDQWHTPYVQASEVAEFEPEMLKKVSVGRCARVSYLNHDGVRDVEADLNLYQRLVNEENQHWSPLEHVATPAHPGERTGNFKGWRQLRSFKEPEVKQFVPNYVQWYANKNTQVA